MDGAAFAQLVNDAGYTYPIYRDLFAAARALDAGDRAPMLRLAAEDLTSVEAGPVESYSEGAYAAVACHDYPTIWNVASGFAARRAELAASRAQLPADAFAPFSQDVWLDSLYEHQLVYGCLRWPAPAVADPPAPPGAAYPTVPVLVLNGDLDVITPMSDAARAAALFPNATLVPVGNAVHVTALADFDDCAARIVRDFLRSHVVGDTSCASELAELHVVPAFPRTTAAAPAATRAAGDASNAGDRRAGWAAAHTVADALSRWWLMYGVRGHGLRGGTFRAGGEYYGTDPVTFRLRGAAVHPRPRGGRPRRVGSRGAADDRARAAVRRPHRPAQGRLGHGRAHGDGHRAREARRPRRAADAARALVLALAHHGPLAHDRAARAAPLEELDDQPDHADDGEDHPDRLDRDAGHRRGDGEPEHEPDRDEYERGSCIGHDRCLLAGVCLTPGSFPARQAGQSRVDERTRLRWRGSCRSRARSRAARARSRGCTARRC